MLYAYIAWEPYFTMFTINKTLVLKKKKKSLHKNKMLSFDLFRRSSNKQMDPQFP